jgi:hypothetical protein
MSAEQPRNSFRAQVVRNERPSLIVSRKDRPRDDDGDPFARLTIPRTETRRGNHRTKDRHRLTGEAATVRYGGEDLPVELVNLSAGGAMIRAGFGPRLWDMVELRLGEEFGLEGAVRWIKGDLIGLEFAHETRIDCGPEERSSLLLGVIRRSFADQQVSLGGEVEDLPEAEAEAEPEEDQGNRDGKRHPLIWMGEIHYSHDSNPVRLRNISAGGMLIDAAVDYPVGAEVLLDLGEAGQFFAIVQWTLGDKAGLRFARPFDIACLANAKPQVTPPKWDAPTFLDRVADKDSAWDARWNRSSIDQIRADLEGLKRR